MVKKINFSLDTKGEDHKLELVFLGNRHDREFQFLFSNVRQYRIDQSVLEIDLDLITFEIGIQTLNDEFEEDWQEYIVFRATFAGQVSDLVIYANNITVSEIIYE